MNILFDPHVHYYKSYSTEKFFSSAYRNFERHNSISTGFALCLTEKNDCDFFIELRSKSKILDFQIVKNPSSLLLKSQGKLPLYIIPGRQVNSSEGIEVLALFRSDKIEEKMPLIELVSEILNSGGIPVINWAPGKWLGKRGIIIDNFIQNHNGHLALGYTSLLPKNFPLPKIILKHKENLPIFWGSDPLPFKNQESLIAQCGLEIDVSIDPNDKNELDISQFKTSLLKSNFSYFGHGSNILDVSRRLISNEIVRRF